MGRNFSGRGILHLIYDTGALAKLATRGWAQKQHSTLQFRAHSIVRNNAAATSARIISHETLFRLGPTRRDLGRSGVRRLGLALYRLFEQVDAHRARQMVSLVLVLR